MLLVLAATTLSWQSHLQQPVSGLHQRRISTVSMEISEQRVAQAMEIKPVAETSARATGLALALDDGTRKSHSMAENTQFVTGFFKGISTRSAFSQLVASLYFVYKAQEEAFEATSNADVKTMDYSELRRLASLEEDMEYYFGAEWRATVKPTPATREYCDRIATIASEQPELLIAHQYTRYLGDLFGGQMMGGMARSTLKLDKSKGTRFYEFDEIAPGAGTKAFIEDWYAQLNALDLSEAQQQQIVDEANLVFSLNIKLFNELEGGKRAVVRAVWGLFTNAIKSRVGGGKREATA